MTDIVERLKRGESCLQKGGRTCIRMVAVNGCLCAIAADEITRLTAEMKRLRAALRGTYEVYAGSDGFIPETAAEGYQQQIIKQMVDIISAALTSQERQNDQG